jgi:peptidoglycan/xylan/chitin deacetylase (PgdA/CDA1 family)
VKRTIKSFLGGTIFEGGLNAVLLRNAAVVVAFHRVLNEPASDDSLTTSVSAFEGYCRYFKRHFRVIPLAELVRKLECGQPFNRELAITFDDGYLNNFENAVPVLEKLSLPATFFIVSQWMESDVVPFWDRQLGVRYPWMSWDQVRELTRRGFDVGAHTQTHVDLGKVSAAEARTEILGARLDLESRLSRAVDLFAYPYGGRQHLTDENRRVVRDAGFRCCCSATGELTTVATDPFCLGRVPISPWFGSPHQFGFEVALGMTPAA